jgi:hypothetical protein
VGFPGYKWSSSEDVSNTFPGVQCERLEKPLPGSSWANLRDWYKVLRLIGEL